MSMGHIFHSYVSLPEGFLLSHLGRVQIDSRNHDQENWGMENSGVIMAHDPWESSYKLLL